MIDDPLSGKIPLETQILLWLALFIGFAIKIPAFPFHTWLPDAHVEAPTAISVILAGVLLKMGTYGILRINYGILPAATLAPVEWLGGLSLAVVLLAALGTWNIVYGALCAMAQTDLKKLVAYSSISHMGYVMLGMAVFTPQGINGAVLQMFNHGTITAMLFLLVGVVYDRAHHRNIDGFGGLASIVPLYTGVTGITPTSPALSVAQNADRAVLSVITEGNTALYLVSDPQVLEGQDLRAPAATTSPDILPPAEPIADQLADLLLVPRLEREHLIDIHARHRPDDLAEFIGGKENIRKPVPRTK